MTLYHYTCHHGYLGIVASGQLRPHGHPWFDEPLVWLTDLAEPWRDALGLTSHTIDCDRTRYRFQVADSATTIRWTSYRRSVPRRTAITLENQPGSMPAHWWVSAVPVPVLLPMS